MKLRKFIARIGVSKLAQELGTTKQRVHNWSTGNCKPNGKMALKILELSKGKLTAKDLS